MEDMGNISSRELVNFMNNNGSIYDLELNGQQLRYRNHKISTISKIATTIFNFISKIIYNVTGNERFKPNARIVNYIKNDVFTLIHCETPITRSAFLTDKFNGMGEIVEAYNNLYSEIEGKINDAVEKIAHYLPELSTPRYGIYGTVAVWMQNGEVVALGGDNGAKVYSGEESSKTDKELRVARGTPDFIIIVGPKDPSDDVTPALNFGGEGVSVAVMRGILAKIYADQGQMFTFNEDIQQSQEAREVTILSGDRII